MVAQAFRKLGIQNEFLEADLPPMVDLGLQKIYGFQHNDGGWGWWYDDSSNVDQTAFVVYGLAMTEQAGFGVDAGVLERGAAALRAMLPGADPGAQAYSAYVLAMASQPVSVTLTLTDAMALDRFSQAALAMAYAATGDEESASALLDVLREAAIQDDSMVYWSDSGDNAVYGRKAMGSTVRTTAMVADALARLDPGSPLLPKSVRYLMSRRQGHGWGDTQRTTYSILALTDYLLASRDLSAGAAYQVFVNAELWDEGRLADPDAGQTLTVPLSALLPGENRIGLSLGESDDGRISPLYYAVTLSTQRSPEEGRIGALQNHERSISVQREYRPVDGDRARDSGEPDALFQQGDLVEVILTLDVPEVSWYIVVDDPLPAGFEALNERLATTSHVATSYEDPGQIYGRFGYNRKDVRDDRVAFFFTRLDPGQHTLSYLARATSGGSFVALPTQVYPMYEPEIWSRSDSTHCQVGMR
jgi:uncharacterized protein YfaS (alpha-2-macroglobulin family)